MNPDDVAAIRDELRAEKCSLVRVSQLCDALEAAWAEGLESYDHGARDGEQSMRVRAERAEAALARVRALCDEWRADGMLVLVDELRAAIEEDED